MAYLDRILGPSEKVIYRARIHWIVYVSGIFFITLAIFLAYNLKGMGDAGSAFYYQAIKFPWLKKVPHVAVACSFLYGTYCLIRGFLIAYFTELAITNYRIIAKFGVYSVTTIEMDRYKIAGIIVHQNPWGRMFGYGQITLRGFANNIAGLPPMSRPYDFQKYANTAMPAIGAVMGSHE